MSKEIRNILVVDDDIEDYELVSEAIKEIDDKIFVDFISKCEEAAEFAKKKIDLILLDINMPLHDGFAWLNGIRSRGFTDVPVVMYTNSMNPVHIQKAYNEGADIYFPKPENFTMLRDGLRKLISLDWTDQLSIRSQHASDGNYRVFGVN